MILNFFFWIAIVILCLIFYKQTEFVMEHIEAFIIGAAIVIFIIVSVVVL